MQIRLQHRDAAKMQDIHRALQADLQQAGLDAQVNLQPPDTQPNRQAQKGGDMITMTTIILTAVGAGGALTVALGKDGFFTQLARVLEKIAEQTIEITVTDKNGQVTRIAGSAGQIRKLLAELNEHAN